MELMEFLEFKTLLNAHLRTMHKTFSSVKTKKEKKNQLTTL